LKRTIEPRYGCPARTFHIRRPLPQQDEAFCPSAVHNPSRPAPPFLLKAGHSFFRKGGATVLPRPQHFRSPLTLAKAAQSISAGRCRSHVTRGSNSFAVAYVYFESEPGRRAAAHLMTKDEARKVAAGIAKLPDLLGAARREDGNPLVQRMP
jgi:hypothetical protein